VGALAYPPVDGRPYRVTLGLRTLDLSEWLDIDEHFDTEMARKNELLTDQHQQVVATLPIGDEAAAEGLQLITAHLVQRFPDHGSVPDRTVHPIDAAGRLVQEDLCVMQRIDGEWRLVAASVCFPSRWDLQLMIGRSLHQIHAPVPDYDKIADPTAGFFDRLTESRPMWRLNWSLLDDAELFQQGRGGIAKPEVPVAGYTLRVERQTLRRLPVSGAVLFTIRTYRSTLGELAIEKPEFLADLAATLATVSSQTQDYKGWTEPMPRILAWLHAR